MAMYVQLGSVVRPQAPELVAGRFEVVRFIGYGGMGDAYEAKDLQLGGRVALKTIRLEFRFRRACDRQVQA
jgi:hypothetical protein